MVFSSLLFLCLFFPVVIVLYYSLPKKTGNALLFAVSLLFYAWGEPKYVLIMLFSTVFDFCNGLLIEKYSDNGKIKKSVLITSVCVNLLILCFFKYTDFAIESIDRLTGLNIGALSLALPVGISFYTFQTLSYTIDVYRGRVKAQHSIVSFGTYICLFPQLIAGPIVRYSDIDSQLTDRVRSIDGFFDGLTRFTVGMGKKVLLANQIGQVWDEMYLKGNSLGTGEAWLGAIAFAFQIYFDFSGYSDMAIGLGKMLGFEFPENFRHPYEADSITDFWRRWHITLGTWFREYLYIPLGGNRCTRSRNIFNLLVVWLLTGLWHGAGYNFILWGLYYFVLISVEKYGLMKLLQKLPSALRHIYTLFFVVLGWVIFACEDITVLPRYIRSMFCFTAGDEWMYYLKTNVVLFIILIFASTSLTQRAGELIKSRQKTVTVIKTVMIAVILFFSISMLVSDSYNPFLYFRF